CHYLNQKPLTIPPPFQNQVLIELIFLEQTYLKPQLYSLRAALFFSTLDGIIKYIKTVSSTLRLAKPFDEETLLVYEQRIYLFLLLSALLFTSLSTIA